MKSLARLLFVAALASARSLVAEPSAQIAVTRPNTPPVAKPIGAQAHQDVWQLEMDRISRLSVAKEGIEPVIEGYKQLIGRFPQDPRRAEAMYQIAATYWGIAIPELGITNDPEKGLEWLKKADAAAIPGSAIWNTTHLSLARWQPLADAKESRRLLDEVESRAKGNTLLLANVEAGRQSVCVSEGDLGGAVEHCKRILQANYEPNALPTDQREKSELDGVKRGALGLMLERIEHSPLPQRDALRAQLIKGNEFQVEQFILQQKLRRGEMDLKPPRPGPPDDAHAGKVAGGLQFRLSAPRTVFQAWELPTFVMEVRNGTDRAVTAEMVQQVFGEPESPWALRFFFKDQHRRGPNPNNWLVPEVRMNSQKFIGLKPAETTTETVVIAAMREQSSPKWAPYELSAGRYTIGLGVLVARPRAGLGAELKTNDVTLTVLPPGVRSPEELAGFLKPYVAGGKSITAGFVPNKTTVVQGEPILATFIVENPGEDPFTFAFGGDYRGSGRHNRFKIDVTGPDGKSIEDPSKGPDMGGILMSRTAQGHDAVVETVDLTKYRAISGPEKLKVTCRFVLTPSWNQEGKEGFNVPVETTYDLVILPRAPENVQRVLGEMFDQANKTAGLPLQRLIGTISSFGQESAAAGLTTMGANGDVEHRVAAAKGLGKIATPSATEALVRMNSDAVIEVRAAAIASLEASTDVTAVETVVRALSDPDGLIQKAAAGALGQMKTEAAIDALIGRLPNADAEVGAAILRGMGTSQSSRVFAIIVRSLASENGVIRRAALDAIANFPVKDAADALRQYAASDADMDFREAVARKLAESLKQPIEMAWLTPVIKSRRTANSIGDAPRLMRLYGGEQAVPAMLSCLDFDNPAVRSYYNMTVVDQQLACQGALAIPWHADLNRDGTAAETEENRRTLRILKAWVEYYRTHPIREDPSTRTRSRAEEEKTWGEAVDGLSIRARVERKVWPAGLPQVATVDARSLPGEGSVTFSSRPTVLEVEVDSQWYSLPKDAGLAPRGDWNVYHGNQLYLQLDERWRRKLDQQALELKPGSYTVRVGVSRAAGEKRTGVAMSRPVKFEVIATE